MGGLEQKYDQGVVSVRGGGTGIQVLDMELELVRNHYFLDMFKHKFQVKHQS